MTELSRIDVEETNFQAHSPDLSHSHNLCADRLRLVLREGEGHTSAAAPLSQQGMIRGHVQQKKQASIQH